MYVRTTKHNSSFYDWLWTNLTSISQHSLTSPSFLQSHLTPPPSFIHLQPDINPNMRAILVDWLVEVAEEFQLHLDTLHLAVSYTDRYLSKVSVPRNKLQLLGTTSLYIAAKYEEIHPPEIGEFAYITDDTYTKKQVLKQPVLVLYMCHGNSSRSGDLCLVISKTCSCFNSVFWV